MAIALAVVHPRLRPGVRASMALICGSLAVVAGIVDGLRHVLADRLAGDDLTAAAWLAALLALAAGVVLVAHGGAVLWRSRRRDEPRPRRYGRGALVAIAGWSPSTRRAARRARNRRQRQGQVAGATRRPRRPYREVALTTDDGLTLAGWYASSRNRAAVIVFPGREGPVAHARMLTRRGFGVLILDRRGEGERRATTTRAAGAARATSRPPELPRAWRRRDPERIGGLGLSVGESCWCRRLPATGAFAPSSPGRRTAVPRRPAANHGHPQSAALAFAGDHGDRGGCRAREPPAAGWARRRRAADRASARAAHQRWPGQPG